MTQSTHAPDVPLARGGAVTNSLLDQMIELSHAAQAGTLSDEGALLILQNLPGLLAELRHRRRVQELIHSASDPENVIFLPA